LAMLLVFLAFCVFKVGCIISAFACPLAKFRLMDEFSQRSDIFLGQSASHRPLLEGESERTRKFREEVARRKKQRLAS